MRGILLDALIIGGLMVQGIGFYLLAGEGWAAAIVGSEILAIGLVGATLNAVR